MSKKPTIITQTDDFGRKKFTLQHQSQSEPEQPQHAHLIDTGKHASTLVGREQKLNIQKYMGKIQTNKKKKKKEVFYCQVCSIGFKCDLAYITHINSPSHNRKLGMNMKVEAVSVDTVANKLAKMAEEKNKSKVERIMEKKLGKGWEAGLLRRQDQSERVSKIRTKIEQQQEDQQQNEQNKKIKNPTKIQPNLPKTQQHQIKAKIEDEQQRREEQPQGEQDEQQEQDDELLMKSLGLPTQFGSRKKKY